MSLTDEDVLKIISKLKKALEQETHSVWIGQALAGGANIFEVLEGAWLIHSAF